MIVKYDGKGKYDDHMRDGHEGKIRASGNCADRDKRQSPRLEGGIRNVDFEGNGMNFGGMIMLVSTPTSVRVRTLLLSILEIETGRLPMAGAWLCA